MFRELFRAVDIWRQRGIRLRSGVPHVDRDFAAIAAGRRQRLGSVCIDQPKNPATNGLRPGGCEEVLRPGGDMDADGH
jgi:hypothetical protein